MNETMDCTTYLRQIGKHDIAEYVERLRDNAVQLERALLEARRESALQEATNRQILENYEPVRHGRWIPMYEEIEMLTTEGWIMRETQTAWKCSECGREEEIARDTMPYCHCGAKMDAEV